MVFDLNMKEQIRAAALELGFVRAGFAPVASLPHREHLLRWVADGNAAGMEYMTRDPGARADPVSLSPTARTALVVLAAHPTPPDPPPGAGVVARFALGPDYHTVIRSALDRLLERINALAGAPVEARMAVDTSPLLERELAAAAGLGFIGKNNMLITPGVGSYTLIGVLLLPLEIPPDAGELTGCGRCRRCLDACPTGALTAPYCLDSRKCISYLSIEERGGYPEEHAAAMGGRVFGCDRCQEACPYNARAPGRVEPLPGLVGQEPGPRLPLARLMGLGKGEHRRLVQGTALRRTPRHRLRRNAALAAGSLGPACPADARAALRLAAADHRPLVSAAAAWALRRLGEELS